MTTILATTNDISREEWLKLRKEGLGGSDASVVMGVNPWKSPMDLWLEKTDQYEEDIDSEAAYWGSVLEDIVAREFTKRTGLKVRRRNAILQHHAYPFMLANVDRLIVGKKAGLEVKTGSAYGAKNWQDDQIPEMYYAQVQHYMFVTGLPVWHIAALIGGQTFIVREVYEDQKYQEIMVDAEWDFWQLVQTNTPPPADGSEACTKILSKLYPEAEKGKEAQLPLEAFPLVQQFEDAGEAEKAAKLRKDEAANKLKEMLGDSERGFIHDRKVSWTNVVTRRFDSKRFQKDYHEIYDQYTNESLSRRFSIK